ncbi:MAG: sodium ion-translocating decarboxylase subunit beta [Clostridia bacterium]|nr:sodium ion-translocating decarboxylase subunit beta [Clostridia bacterium]
MKKAWNIKKHVLFAASATAGISILGHAAMKPLLFALSSGRFSSQEAASVAVIGGADGPTAIYLSGNPTWGWLMPELGCFLILLALYKPMQKLTNKRG